MNTEATDKSKKIKRLMVIFLYRYFRVMVVLFALLLLLVGNSFVIKPKRATIAIDQDEAIENRKLEKDKLLKYLEDLKEYRLEYEKIPTVNRERIKKFLPEDSGKQSLFLEIEKIFLNQKIDISKITISEPSPKVASNSRTKGTTAGVSTGLPDNIGVLEIEIEVGSEVGYTKLKELLTVIESNLRLMDVENLGYDNSTGDLSLLIKTYFIKS